MEHRNVSREALDKMLVDVIGVRDEASHISNYGGKIKPDKGKEHWGVSPHTAFYHGRDKTMEYIHDRLTLALDAASETHPVESVWHRRAVELYNAMSAVRDEIDGKPFRNAHEAKIWVIEQLTKALFDTKTLDDAPKVDTPDPRDDGKDAEIRRLKEVIDGFKRIPTPAAGIDPADLKHPINALCGNHCTETGCKAKTKADCDKCAIGMHLKDLNALVDEAGDPVPIAGIDPAKVEKVMDELGKVPLTSTNILDANKQKWATVDALAALIEAAKKQVPMVPAPDYPSNQSEGCAICGVPGKIGRAIYLCTRCADKPMVPWSIVEQYYEVLAKIVGECGDEDGKIGYIWERFLRDLAPYRPAPKGDEPKCKTCRDKETISMYDIKLPGFSIGTIPCPDCADATESFTEADAKRCGLIKTDDGDIYLIPNDIRAKLATLAYHNVTTATNSEPAVCPVCEKNKAEIHATQRLVHLAAKVMSGDYTEKELALYDALEADAEREDGDK